MRTCLDRFARPVITARARLRSSLLRERNCLVVGARIRGRWLAMTGLSMPNLLG
jgi:hypothetical protein